MTSLPRDLTNDDRRPTVSIVIPTLNAEAYLDECLSSVMVQDYPRDRVELLIADGGSTDSTIEIARRHGISGVIPNPLRTGESGKAFAIREATGEIILLLDSDNILVGSDWLTRIVAPFIDPEVWGSQSKSFAYRRSDPALIRYNALLGAGDPLTVYAGNYDRLSVFTGTWTGCAHVEECRSGWTRVIIDPDAIPTLGANGFAFRADVLPDEVRDQPYFFDIDVAAGLIRGGHLVVALVDVPIVHLFCRDVATYRRKTRRRVDDFMCHRSTSARSYGWGRQRRGIVRFIVSTVLVFPLVIDAMRGWRRTHDPAVFLHILIAWITLLTYVGGVIRGFRAPSEFDRSGWRQ